MARRALPLAYDGKESTMTRKTSWSPGEALWVDLSTPDLDASRAFYGGLFGWEAEPGDPAFGGYTSFALGGRKVAGVMPLMSPDQPTTWTCYLCSDDADKTTGLVEQGGGAVLVPPMDVADLGRMAVYADPVGAVFGIWQPGAHPGAELVEEEGTLAWVELATRDQAAAQAFYETVFGWTARASADYTELQLAGSSVAGCMDVPPGVPEEVPSYWMPYFAAADPQAQGERVVELGGTVVAPRMDFPGGRFLVAQDLHGAVFGLLDVREP
jgi:predicted enzyme related to lactoylglutathione lyase